MEEYLLSQLDTPVVLKDGTMMTKPDGSPMTKQEAIATNILNLAMKGDVKAAQIAQHSFSPANTAAQNHPGCRQNHKFQHPSKIYNVKDR